MNLVVYCAQCNVLLKLYGNYYECDKCGVLNKKSLVYIDEVIQRASAFGLDNSWIKWESEKSNILIKTLSYNDDDEAASIFCDMLEKRKQCQQ